MLLEKVGREEENQASTCPCPESWAQASSPVALLLGNGHLQPPWALQSLVHGGLLAWVG